ncbi:MAG TPA: hypothetical protein PLM75_07785 [bacterium]|nr:hypothetical protein [bacterium]
MKKSEKPENFKIKNIKNNFDDDFLGNDALLTPLKFTQTSNNIIEDYSEKMQLMKSKNYEGKIILMQRDYLGNAQNVLDLSNFFETLIQIELLPSKLILIKDAVKLISYESVAQSLRKLEKLKVEILIEKEALMKFDLLDKVSIGKIFDFSNICILLMTNQNILSL